MAAVNKGGSRQELHEKLRKLSFAAQKKGDPLKFLLSEIGKDPDFRLKSHEIKPYLSIPSLIGRAPDQTLSFLKMEVDPFLAKHKKRKFTSSPVEI